MVIIAFIITAAAVAVDQASKLYIKNSMELGESFSFIPGVLNIRYIENPGASFGILADHRWVFMSFSAVALAFMFAAIFYMNKRELSRYNRLPSVALALMFGGGIGNMIDRFFNVSEDPRREGVNVVVDFLELDFVDFAIFNFADVFITAGSLLFCACIFLGKYKIGAAEERELIYEDGCGGISGEAVQDGDGRPAD